MAKATVAGPTTLDGLRAAIHADFERAASSLYHVESRDGSGLQLLSLWQDQLALTRAMQQQRAAGQPMRALVLKTRRAGMSTAAAAWVFHHTYWRPRQHAMIVAHSQETTSVLYDISRTLYNELPEELQIPLERLNRKELRTVSPWSSSLVAQTAGFLDLGRGATLQHVQLSEADYYPDPATALDGVLNAVHLGPQTSITIESTANGAAGWMAHFWRASKAGQTGFVTIFSPWFNVPEHRLMVPVDFELTDEEAARQEEFGLTLEQMAWYRYKRNETIAKEPWGGERKMKQEHPYDEQEAFQASGMCVFPDTVLRRLALGCAPPLFSRRLEHMAVPGEIRPVPCDYHPDWPLLNVWERPDPDRYYALGVDISDGVGQSESVISVCRYPGYEQVAEWASSTASPEETAYVTRWLAEWYGGGNCVVVPEINRNGPLILNILQNLPGNYGIFRWRYFNRPGGAVATENATLGWETSGNTKPVLVQIANTVYLRGQAAVRSQTLHEQMTRCIDIMPGKVWAARGGRSDRIIAWLIGMAGCYLDYEGGSIGNIISDNPKQVGPEANDGWREPNQYDAGLDSLLGAPMAPVGTGFAREDLRG